MPSQPGRFIYPDYNQQVNAGYYGNNLVWTVGQTYTISWNSSIPSYDLTLWHQTGGKDSDAFQVTTLMSYYRNGAGVQRYQWMVDTYGQEIDGSPVYFFWTNPDEDNSTISAYFNITEASSSSTSASSIMSSTTSSTASRTTSGAITITTSSSTSTTFLSTFSSSSAAITTMSGPTPSSNSVPSPTSSSAGAGAIAGRAPLLFGLGFAWYGRVL